MFLTNVKKVGLLNIISLSTTTKVSIFQIFTYGSNPSIYQLNHKYDKIFPTPPSHNSKVPPPFLQSPIPTIPVILQKLTSHPLLMGIQAGMHFQGKQDIFFKEIA